MKSKIFSTDQISAIQDGRMTQFMQVVKPQPEIEVMGGEPYEAFRFFHNNASPVGMTYKGCRYTPWPQCFIRWCCPFGRIGDVIYCRETLYQNGELGLMYQADQEWIDTDIIPDSFKPVNNYAFCKIPSCQMPPWAARLFLRITNIRVMRVQDLTEEDAIKQGVEYIVTPIIQGYRDYSPKPKEIIEAITNTALSSIQSLDEKRWQNNPYMWIIDFTKIEKP